SVEEEELNEFLSADDDLNLSDEPTQEKPSKEVQENENENEHVAFDIPEFTPVISPPLPTMRIQCLLSTLAELAVTNNKFQLRCWMLTLSPEYQILLILFPL
ncbi:MAG: hypothetical protein ACK53Y_04375, partial [bacterium]